MVVTVPWHHIHITELHEFQRQVPFDIIVPGYLPPGFGDNVSIRIVPGNLFQHRPDDWICVEMVYRSVSAGDCPGQINVYQSNYPVILPDPELNPEYWYSDIAGVEVVEIAYIRRDIFDTSLECPEFSFGWDQEGMYFTVDVYGYDHSEAVKIIESMIEQGRE